MSRPNTGDYPEYFGKYIAQVPEEDLMMAFQNQMPVIEQFLDTINEETANFSYAPGKWTIKEMWQHIIDAERVFSYRALCFARKETVSLPSFDENNYANNSNANSRTWKSIVEEFINLRHSTIDLYRSFPAEVMSFKGLANEKQINVLSLGFIIIGHIYHHMMVGRERYGLNNNVKLAHS